jgi:hypothetical protein
MKQVGPYSRTLLRGAIGDAVDGRSREGRFMRAYEQSLVQHVGGEPTAVQRVLISRATRLAMHIELMDTSTDRDRVPAGRQRVREPHGCNQAPPVLAVALVTRGSDSGDVGSRSSYGNKPRGSSAATLGRFSARGIDLVVIESQDSRPAETLQ